MLKLMLDSTNMQQKQRLVMLLYVVDGCERSTSEIPVKRPSRARNSTNGHDLQLEIKGGAALSLHCE